MRYTMLIRAWISYKISPIDLKRSKVEIIYAQTDITNRHNIMKFDNSVRILEHEYVSFTVKVIL